MEQKGIEEITHIVLRVIEGWEKARSRPASSIDRFLTYISNRWFFFTILFSVFSILIGWLVFRISPFQPLERLANEQAEYREKEAERGFKRELVEGYLRLGKLFLDVGQYKEAEKVYKEALELDPLNIRTRMAMLRSGVYALAAEGQYDPEVIRKRIEFIQGDDPNDPHANMVLGEVYAPFDTEKAIGHFRRAIAKDPQVAAAYFGLGNIYLQQNKTDDAQVQFKKAVEISPWNVKYLNNLASVQIQKGEYTSAIENYEKGLQLDADFLPTHVEIANACQILGRFEDAERYQRRLAKLLDDARITALEKNNISWYFTIREDTIYLDTLAQQRCYAYYTLSTTLYLLGNPEEAETYAEKAGELNVYGIQNIKALVAHDLKIIQDKHPIHTHRIEQYTNTFLRP